MTHNVLNYALFLLSAAGLYGISVFLVEIIDAGLKRDRDPAMPVLVVISILLVGATAAAAFAAAAGALGMLLQ